MTGVANSDATRSTYVFAGDGLRRSLQEPGGPLTTTIWDGADYLQERPSGGTVVRYTNIESEIAAEKRSGVRSLYVPDPLGSTAALVNASQEVTDTMAFWPYGEVSARTGSNPTPFQFVGTLGYHFDAARRIYVRARVEDPATGRWLTEDPVTAVRRIPSAANYCWDNPTSLIDPSGMAPWWTPLCCNRWLKFCCPGPRKPRPLPPPPSGGPWTPPVKPPGLPPVAMPPYCAPKGTPIPKATCLMFCHLTLCPGPLSEPPVVCDDWCSRECNGTLAIGSVAQACHRLSPGKCAQCCDDMLTSHGAAVDVCTAGCSGMGIE